MRTWSVYRPGAASSRNVPSAFVVAPTLFIVVSAGINTTSAEAIGSPVSVARTLPCSFPRATPAWAEATPVENAKSRPAAARATSMRPACETNVRVRIVIRPLLLGGSLVDARDLPRHLLAAGEDLVVVDAARAGRLGVPDDRVRTRTQVSAREHLHQAAVR